MTPSKNRDHLLKRKLWFSKQSNRIGSNLVADEYERIRNATLSASYLDLLQSFLTASSQKQAMFELDKAIKQKDGKHLIGFTIYIVDCRCEPRRANPLQVAYATTFTPIYMEGRGCSVLLIEYNKQELRPVTLEGE